jgi:hypothetical protein
VFEDPLELLRNVNLFLASFNDRPDQVAVPYSVTLAPLVIAEGPLPPNEADLQHAQDVLIFCAKRRSTLTDQLNTFQYIVDNPARFDFSNGASLPEISRASETVQSDLDLIARCASHAMSDPKNAKFPEDFATSIGEEYPRTIIPEILPTAKPAVVPTQARFDIPMTLDGVLLVGGWRNASELPSMSEDDKFNTVATELSGRTFIPSDQPYFLQQFSIYQLIGKAAVYIFILKAGIRTIEYMKSMSTEDLRNTLIVANDARTHQGSALQGLDDQQNVHIALDWYNREAGS